MKSVDAEDIVGKSIVFYGAATQGSASARMTRHADLHRGREGSAAMSEAALAAETDVILRAEGIGKVFPGTIGVARRRLRGSAGRRQRAHRRERRRQVDADEDSCRRDRADVRAAAPQRKGGAVRFGSRSGSSRHRNHFPGTEPVPESQRRREPQPRRSSDPISDSISTERASWTRRGRSLRASSSRSTPRDSPTTFALASSRSSRSPKPSPPRSIS